jgi:hypothetical protein
MSADAWFRLRSRVPLRPGGRVPFLAQQAATALRPPPHTPLAHALIPAARHLLPAAPDVTAAADRAELAALELEAQLHGQGRAAAELSARAAGVSAAELSLERRVSGLSRALRGLADLGSPGLDELHDARFPDGIDPLHRPRGRAQIPAWRLLADRLTAHLAHPAAIPLASDLTQLSADLVAWFDQSAHRDDALRDARATTVTARDAAEALREALARLDLEVERAAGGTRSPTYASWAAVAGQLG